MPFWVVSVLVWGLSASPLWAAEPVEPLDLRPATNRAALECDLSVAEFGVWTMLWSDKAALAAAGVQKVPALNASTLQYRLTQPVTLRDFATGQTVSTDTIALRAMQLFAVVDGQQDSALSAHLGAREPRTLNETDILGQTVTVTKTRLIKPLPDASGQPVPGRLLLGCDYGR